MTAEGRQMLLRVMFRIAVDYGDASWRILKAEQEGATNGMLEPERNWRIGCWRGWAQIQKLYDSGQLEVSPS